MLGHRLLTSLLEKKDVSEYYNAKLSDKYFVSEELAIYKFIENHLKSYGALPDPSTVKTTFGDLPEAPEPPAYYLGKVEERFGFSAFNKALQNSAELLKKKDIQGLVNQFDATTSLVKNSELRFQILDFGLDAAKRFKKIHADSYAGTHGIKLGWQYLDTMTDGMVAGDIFSIVGRPASGKTFLNLWVAYSAYIHQAKNVLFLSMEMNVNSILMRMTGVLTQANMTELSKGKLSTKKQKEIYATLNNLSGLNNKLWIVDGSLRSTVGDVDMLIHQFKPDLVVVDGAYLLKHANPKLDRFTRVAENVEHLKQVAEQRGVPMLLSYQFSREASKKKAKGESAGIEDIAYSDAIGQISSVVLGLNQPESSETLNERMVKIMKGRNGEEGQFNIKWDFTNVNFAQVATDDTDAEHDSGEPEYND